MRRLLVILALCGILAGAGAQEPGAPSGHAAAAGEAGRRRNPEGNALGEVGPVHEAGEEGPVIENWWSCDYGPGKAHRNPPFGFAIINFVVFLAILWRLAGKSLVEFVHDRHHTVRRALDEAQAIRRKAQEELERYRARVHGLEAEIEALIAGVLKEAGAERQRIIAAAEAHAEQLRRDAEAQIEAEIARARADLQRQVAILAASTAESLVKSHFQEGDHKRMVDEFVAQLEAMAPPAGSGRTPKPTAPGPGTGRTS